MIFETVCTWPTSYDVATEHRQDLCLDTPLFCPG